MVDLKNIKAVYFIGIGGIGMSALARYFKGQGKEVNGYDKTETVLTEQLVQEGIGVDYTDAVERIPKKVELVVYTPAIPAVHQGLQYYRDHDYEVLKRSDVLGLITAGSLNVCVAGTHGKTTISTLIAFILRDSGFGCNAFLGGISANYQTNFWSNERNVCVVEADEYDRSFLKLHPDIAVISSMDADHLDIYGTAGAVQDAFIEFSAKVKSGGTLISKYGLPLTSAESITQQRYSLTELQADIHAGNIRMSGGSYVFDVLGKNWKLKDVKLNIGGWHNIENTLAAIAVSKVLGLSDDQVKAAVDRFRGVKRRFEYHALGKGAVYIDDYAHHPKELSALISSAKALFPDRKSVVIFQPHLFSRTRDFAPGFAESLDMADEVILLPVYPARELPISGISSSTILDKMKNRHKQILDKKEIMEWVGKITGKEKLLLITAGAGDIDTLVKPIAEMINA
jgi:UDP-N-acetylmuramate--alanine ligase